MSKTKSPKAIVPSKKYSKKRNLFIVCAGLENENVKLLQKIYWITSLLRITADTALRHYTGMGTACAAALFMSVANRLNTSRHALSTAGV